MADHEGVVGDDGDGRLSDAEGPQLADVTEHLRSPAREFVTCEIQILQVGETLNWRPFKRDTHYLEGLGRDDGDAVELEGQRRQVREVQGPHRHLVDVVQPQVEIGQRLPLVDQGGRGDLGERVRLHREFLKGPVGHGRG